MASAPPVSGSRLRQAGWALALGVSFAVFLVLTFHVNAIKSEVRLAERRIIAMEEEMLMLEVEFQTRASQRQLAAWNAVEFGYLPPRADQFLESERQLASLGLPRGLNAPDPIRVARAESVEAEDESLFAEWVSPLTGESLAEERAAAGRGAADDYGEGGATSLARRLARASPLASVAEARQ